MPQRCHDFVAGPQECLLDYSPLARPPYTVPPSTANSRSCGISIGARGKTLAFRHDGEYEWKRRQDAAESRPANDARAD